VQAKYRGGLVSIFDGGTGHVSVVGSTLASITVRAHTAEYPLEYPRTAAPVRRLRI
jgi:hypothetical protein